MVATLWWHGCSLSKPWDYHKGADRRAGGRVREAKGSHALTCIAVPMVIVFPGVAVSALCARTLKGRHGALPRYTKHPLPLRLPSEPNLPTMSTVVLAGVSSISAMGRNCRCSRGAWLPEFTECLITLSCVDMAARGFTYYPKSIARHQQLCNSNQYCRLQTSSAKF